MKKEEIELVEKWKPVLEYIGDEVPRIPSKDLLQHAKHFKLYLKNFARRHDRSVRAITGLPMLLVTSYRRNFGGILHYLKIILNGMMLNILQGVVYHSREIICF